VPVAGDRAYGVYMGARVKVVERLLFDRVDLHRCKFAIYSEVELAVYVFSDVAEAMRTRWYDASTIACITDNFASFPFCPEAS